MGIRFTCHECGKKLNVKSFLAGKRGICPDCDARFLIPAESGGLAQPVTKSSPAPGATNGLSAAVNLGGASTSSAPQGALTTPTTGSPAARPASTILNPTAPASDPLAESPNSVWYVRPSSGGQFGPAAGDMMREWIDQGRVAADSLVWREGWAEWQSASALFPQLNSPAPAVAAAPATAAVAPVAAAASTPAATPVAAATTAPVLGPSSTTSPASTIRPMKRSNGLTGLMVVILVLVAIFLMVVFAYILYRQGGSDEYNEARRSGRSVEIVQAFDEDTPEQL